MFQFRFPIAILHYLDSDQSPFGSTSEKSYSRSAAYQNAVEKAREFAKPIGDEKRKRPTVKDAEAYLNKLIEVRQEEKDDRTNKRYSE